MGHSVDSAGFPIDGRFEFHQHRPMCRMRSLSPYIQKRHFPALNIFDRISISLLRIQNQRQPVLLEH